MLTAGSPLSKDPVLIKIAEKHNVSPATVLISYAIGRGIVVLPKSVTPSRIESNLQTINLPAEDIDELNKLATEGGKQQRINSPPWGTDFVRLSPGAGEPVRCVWLTSPGFPSLLRTQQLERARGSSIARGQDWKGSRLIIDKVVA
jgi:hypothetical protein